MCNKDLKVRNESTGNDKGVNSEARKRKTRSISAQVLASTAQNLVLFAYGLSLGFPTIVIPSVHNAPTNGTLNLTDDEASWFGSIRYIVNPVGCIASGLLSNTFGRKRSVQLVTMSILLSWIVFYYADSVMMLWVGVALIGFTGGIVTGPVLTYVSEISEPYVRGILSATSTLSVNFGVFGEFLLGSFIDWRTLCIINAVTPIISFTVLFFIPESPYWLIGKNRFEDTQKALCWLRGWTTKKYIQDEYNQLVNEIHPNMKTRNDDKEDEQKNRFWTFNINNYLKRTFVLPFLLIVFISVLVDFTGITALSTYAINIFNSFGAPINAYYATIFFGLTRFAGPFASICLIHRTGKRPLVFFSLIGMGILFGMAGLYGYFYLGVRVMDNGAHVQEHFQGTQKYSWLPMACFIAAPFFGYVGVRLLPWLLIGEVYPPEIRGVATGISAGLGSLMSFAANKTFFDLVSVFTLPGVFIFYAVVFLTSLAGFYFWLPETEGWSLSEVEEHFAGKRNLVKAGRKEAKVSVADPEGQDNPVPIMD